MATAWQSVKGSSGHLWAGRYDGSLTDIADGIHVGVHFHVVPRPNGDEPSAGFARRRLGIRSGLLPGYEARPVMIPRAPDRSSGTEDAHGNLPGRRQTAWILRGHARVCELFAISSRLPATVSLSLKTLAEHGGGSAPHADGWGIAFEHRAAGGGAE